MDERLLSAGSSVTLLEPEFDESLRKRLVVRRDESEVAGHDPATGVKPHHRGALKDGSCMPLCPDGGTGFR